MINLITQLVKLISVYRFDLSNEKKIQSEIQSILIKSNIKFEREKKLSKFDIPDFIIDGKIVIEVKIKGSLLEIFRQCERYCQYPEIESIILITNRAMGWPDKINGKPAYYISLGLSWL